MSNSIKLEKGIIDNITEPTLKKLIDSGITTVQALSVQTPQSLAEASGMSEETAGKVIGKAQKILDLGFINAIQLREIRTNRTHLKTGCEEFDALIGGGFESETTTEIASDGGIGKTQICHTLAVLAQRPVEEGGLNGDVAWIDSMPNYEVLMCRINGVVEATTFESLYNRDLYENIIPHYLDTGEEIKTPRLDILIEVPDYDRHRRLRWKKLNHIVRHPYKGKILQINTTAGVVDVSPNHPLMKDDLSLVNAEDVQEGDLLYSKEFEDGLFVNDGQRGRELFIGPEELAWLYGIFAAEGWTSGKHWLLSNTRKDIIDKICDIVRRIFHFSPTILEEKGVYKVDVNSPKMVKYFNDRMYLPNINKKDSTTKRVPPEIINGPDLIYDPFIEGYFMGDGFQDRERVRGVVSTSRTLLLGIDYIYRVSYSLHTRTDKPTVVQLIYNKSRERHSQPNKVKKITESGYDGYLYDIEVDSKNHTFCMGIGNIRCHNTEDTFTPARIEQIARARGFDPEEILKHIHWALAKNSDNQKQLIVQLFELVPRFNIKLVIVDSMISHLRGEYIGREMLQSRQSLLGLMLQTLLRISQSMKVTTIFTNQVMDEPVLFGAQKPAGGHRMAHSAGTRLQLRRGREGARVAKLIDSLSLPEGECVFYITEKGIEGKPKKEEEKE